jgi:hypothetical protein
MSSNIPKRSKKNTLMNHCSSPLQEREVHFHEAEPLFLPIPVDKIEELRNSVVDVDDNDVPIGFTKKEYGITSNNPTNRSLQQILSLTGCVYNGTQLQSVIESIPKYSPTKIEVCSHSTSTSASQMNGIFIDERQLDIYCNISSNVMMNN